MDPLDILADIFRSMGSGLGEIDRGAGVDPASRPDDGQGPITTNVTHPDGSEESFTTDGQGGYTYKSQNAEGTVVTTIITQDKDGGGFTVDESKYSRDGQSFRRTVHYVNGVPMSPGEDGSSDANSDRNPLSGMNVIGPQSMWTVLAGMQHPGKDPAEVDPNTGLSSFTLSESEQARLGLIVPAMEVLDPNSGMDPLSQLNLDPTQLHGRTEDDDRIDPNTGLNSFTAMGQATVASSNPEDIAAISDSKIE